MKRNRNTVGLQRHFSPFSMFMKANVFYIFYDMILSPIRWVTNTPSIVPATEHQHFFFMSTSTVLLKKAVMAIGAPLV